MKKQSFYIIANKERISEEKEKRREICFFFCS